MSEQLHTLTVACCVLPDCLFPMSCSERHCIVLLFLWHSTAYFWGNMLVRAGTWKALVGLLLHIAHISRRISTTACCSVSRLRNDDDDDDPRSMIEPSRSENADLYERLMIDSGHDLGNVTVKTPNACPIICQHRCPALHLGGASRRCGERSLVGATPPPAVTSLTCVNAPPKAVPGTAIPDNAYPRPSLPLQETSFVAHPP